jgi:hypothetical protein
MVLFGGEQRSISLTGRGICGSRSVSAVCHQAESTFLVETKLFLQISLTFCVVWQATQLCNGYFLSFFNVAEGVDG